MTRLITDLKSVENISLYPVDGFIIADKDFSCYCEKSFTLSKIKTIKSFCEKSNKLLIVNLDRIIEEEELGLLKKRLDEYLNIGIDYFIYSDFAVLAYFKSINKTDQLIYDAKTMITNSYDARIHINLRSLVVISNELSLDEIKEIALVGNCIAEVYGYHQMFYSRRPILSTYATFKKFSKNEPILNNKLLFIKEELRNDHYPLYQNKNGTFVYTSYRYAFFKELNDLKDLLQMVRVNSTFIDEKESLEILGLYRRLIDGSEDPNELYEELIKINNNISGGYLNNKSVLLKENEK